LRTLFKKVVVIIKANWSDPVWSKVISAIIISVSSSLLGIFYFLIKALLKNKSLWDGWGSFIKYLNEDVHLSSKRYLFVLLMIGILTILIPLIKRMWFKKSISKDDMKIPETIDLEQASPIITERSTNFLDGRIADAFPGQRGLKWYKEPRIAVSRLNVLLRNPLFFASGSLEQRDPIWWFRGGSNTSIKSFESLTKTKVLINHYEYEIDEVAIYRDENPEKNFIYIKVKAEQPVGIYKWEKEDYIRNYNLYGFHREEYALFNNKYPVTREEYDDGSAIINGKVIESKSSKLRIRYLSPYNFIVAAKQSPVNSREFDQHSKEILNGMLQGTHDFEQLFDFLQGLDNPLCL
jgi:hypothetical protein